MILSEVIVSKILTAELHYDKNNVKVTKSESVHQQIKHKTCQIRTMHWHCSSLKRNSTRVKHFRCNECMFRTLCPIYLCFYFLVLHKMCWHVILLHQTLLICTTDSVIKHYIKLYCILFQNFFFIHFNSK